MTSTKPRVAPDGLYTLKQTAEALEVNYTTVRRYVKSGYLNPRVRKINNKMVLTGEEILKCWLEMY